MISMLLSSKSIDFVVTGCSSGQGMMIACNSLPDVICGYVENPQDAFLFGRAFMEAEHPKELAKHWKAL